MFPVSFSSMALGKLLNQIVKTGGIHWKFLHSRYYDKYFIYVIPLHFPNSLMSQGLPVTPFYGFRS